jgi:catechol 2,3-dioxygenase-like lactoylglutathione lyase family enzyme
MIRALHHVSLSTPDLDRALAFYRDVLGFTERARASWPEGTEDADAIVGLPHSAARVVALWAHNVHIELFEYTQPTPRKRPTDWRVCDYGITHLCLDVTDIDAEYRRLRARGMSFTAPPRTIFAVRSTYGSDPDGNRIELQETLPGSELSLAEHVVRAAAIGRAPQPTAAVPS